MRTQDELMQIVVGMLTAGQAFKETGDQSLMAVACDHKLTIDEVNCIVGLLVGLLLNTLESVGADVHAFTQHLGAAATINHLNNEQGE